MVLKMVKGYYFMIKMMIKIEKGMKGILKMIKKKEKENFFIIMEMYILEIFLTI